ncbi:MAG: OmpA family protein, partial [Bdellovibrionales bacterium]
PASAPQLPPDVSPLAAPPMRDSIKPSPAQKQSRTEIENSIPGNRFVLDDSVSTLSFTHGSENINKDALPTLDKLAGILQSNGSVRVTLTAYAGMDADASPREARRLSLARALAVRDYLTNKGISSSRIDVRALGANVPSGDADRVDVKAN